MHVFDNTPNRRSPCVSECYNAEIPSSGPQQLSWLVVFITYICALPAMPPIRAAVVLNDVDTRGKGIGRHLAMSHTPSPESMTGTARHGETKAEAGSRLSISSTGFTPRAHGRLSLHEIPRPRNIRPKLASVEEQVGPARVPRFIVFDVKEFSTATGVSQEVHYR